MWQPAILLIAFTGKKSNSEDGVFRLRAGAAMTTLRSAAISAADLLLVPQSELSENLNGRGMEP